jgi:hypothetical protein
METVAMAMIWMMPMRPHTIRNNNSSSGATVEAVEIAAGEIFMTVAIVSEAVVIRRVVVPRR